MAPWLRFLEAYLVQALLRSPAFHRGVEKVAKRVHQIRHGIPPEELGGTKIDQPGQPSFPKKFVDEVRTQLGYAEQQEARNAAGKSTGVKDGSVNARGQHSNVMEEETSDAAWENAQKRFSETPKAGFMQEYMEALREQVKNNKNGK